MSHRGVIRKASSKLKRRLSKYIWANRKYKPAGVVTLGEAAYQGLEFREIRPPYVSSLTLSQGFLDDCSPNLRPKIDVQYPGDYIVLIDGGRIYQMDDADMAILTKDNFLIEELSFQWERTRDILPGKENSIFKNRFFSRPKKFKGKVFSLLSGGGANTYYYHWLFDSMPKLALLHASGMFDQIDYFLVPNTAYKFQREYLAHFGITEDKIINGKELQHIEADSLVIASYTRIKEHLPTWVCDYLHKSFSYPSTRNERNKLIYIGRGDAMKNRKVLNEGELINALEKLGFEVHFLASLTVAEQAQLFNSSKIIVGSHGGGLSNLVYCDPGTKVLEIFPDSYINHLFYDLATKRGLDYHYLICKSATNNSIDELQAETNMVADIEAIVKEARRMIASG